MDVGSVSIDTAMLIVIAAALMAGLCCVDGENSEDVSQKWSY